MYLWTCVRNIMLNNVFKVVMEIMEVEEEDRMRKMRVSWSF